MAKIINTKDYVAVAADSCVHVFFNKLNSDYITLQVPCRLEKEDVAREASRPTSADSISENTVLGIEVSPCGKWLAAITSKKQLALWETNALRCVSVRSTPKTACSLAFSKDCKSIVAVDKAGDALLFPIDFPQNEGQMILGHLSMLLDVVISQDGKFIVTCDRDEKIRVSQFPNAYNIVAYCLGHKEFVSALCILLHDPSVLVSGSGDGTLRLWDYQKGLCISTFDCAPDALKRLGVTINDTDDSSEFISMAVKKIRCGFIDPHSSLLCVLFFGATGCLVYSVNATCVEFLCTLCVKETIFDVSFGENGEVSVYSDNKEEPIKCFTFNKECRIFSPSQHAFAKGICKTLLQSCSLKSDKSSVIPQLFKRKFENVKDYYDQKKARIGS